ncbi:MAG TPA: hypothetical protein PL089_14520 [Ignavibacteria bacterium]|nr:hypothetical protein [Ignavibacteria bacterium]
MITINKFEDLVNKVQYKGLGFSLEIEVYSCCKSDMSGQLRVNLGMSNSYDPVRDDKNLGTIIENYRKFLKEGKNDAAQSYFETKIELLEGQIEKTQFPFPNFTTEFILILSTVDENRRKLMNFYYDRVIKDNLGNIVKNVSEAFKKIDNTISVREFSIKEDELHDNYQLDVSNFKEIPIKSLLIFDDIIDTGATLNQLLLRLSQEKIIDNKTVIKMIVLYNN